MRIISNFNIGNIHCREMCNIVGLILIVLTILAALQKPRPIKLPSSEKITKRKIEALSKTLELFKADTKRYPTTDEGLQALITNPGISGWNGPYIKNDTIPPRDSWSRPLHYQSPGKHGAYDLYSYGKDGQPGGTGEDKDITNWEKGP